MTEDREPPKIYLATPPAFELSGFETPLKAALDAAPVACLRLSLATRDEDDLSRAADMLREIAHARDIPLVIDDHFRLVERLGLDGVHLTDGARRVKEVRKLLGKEAILGAFCGTSRHAGMTAGELGADYIAFGPVSADTLLGDGTVAEPELFQWWSEMIEIPVVAEGGLAGAALAGLLPYTDFICLSDEIWAAGDGPAAALGRIAASL
ncbi:thiamine phosphate synthase [Halovulum dunhuangense]|uniref:Thiamine phosphate synthase n=1 Tax=Halovulum dunhuangense TaxID=1505036 RepID=A0A849L2N6_9RHOB|nr:thiamine phosphate synthase [Halovulum dunhuangense]NNU80477.1 thiamine phosphate synthase [Halovulum dunhuangense]